MTARKLVTATALLVSAFALAAPAHGADAQSSGLLGDANDLLAGTTATLLDESGQLVGEVDLTGGTLTGITGELIGTVDSTTGAIYDTTGNLLGTIDATTGQLLDPLGNVIGGILPPSTATDNGGGGTPGSPGSPTSPGANDVFGSSALSLALSARRTQRLATVARHGVSANTSCSASCGVLAAVGVYPRTARRLGLERGTRAAVAGTATGSAGKLAIRLSSRTRRALYRALPTSRTRKSVRSKRIRAQRLSRSRSASAAQRRKARRSYLRYRRVERRWISSGRVKLVIAAVGMDARGRTTTIYRRSLVVRR